MNLSSRIWTAADCKAADSRTLSLQQVSSLELMERAAACFLQALRVHRRYRPAVPVTVLAGPGNNGGDALALARMLHPTHPVRIFIPGGLERLSADARRNLDRLPPELAVTEGTPASLQPDGAGEGILIDGLFGTGLDRPLGEPWASWVNASVSFRGFRVSIDMPSGLLADMPPDAPVFRADWTGTFQGWKLPLLLPRPFSGEIQVLDIGLLPPQEWEDRLFCLGPRTEAPLVRIRDRFAHKGDFGHALLLAGSRGKAGAAVLAGQAVLRAGAGLLTIHGPHCAEGVLQVTVPEAMYSSDPGEGHLVTLPDLKPYRAVGMGPGLGTGAESGQVLLALLQECTVPLVLDADALNLLALQKKWIKLLPPHTILTPHPGEWDRLAGGVQSPFRRLESARTLARKGSIWIVLKGAHTLIASPEGEAWFNFSGNPGMATAGSGDVLCGLITGFLAQGYPPGEACRLAVYLHGDAGDRASRRSPYREPSVVASDIIACFPDALEGLESRSFPENLPPGSSGLAR